MRTGNWRTSVCIVIVWIMGLGSSCVQSARAAANAFDQTVLHPAIPLLDENGRHVLATGRPYSTRMSCGNGSGSGCHDYDKMNHAYHFEQGRDEAGDGFGKKRGLPHLVSPGYFGGYNCMQGSSTGALAKKANASAAEFGDWGAAGFLKACSSCHFGGGWEEKDRTGVRYDAMPEDRIIAGDGDYFERDGQGGLVRWDWKKSGVREADCLSCHADLKTLRKFPASGLEGEASALDHWGWLQDQKFVEAGFFRYANSALLEFLDVRPGTPDGAQLLAVQRTLLPATAKPDYHLALDGQGLPILHWNPAAFDGNGKVQIPMRRFPDSDNCMICHLAGEGINRVTVKQTSSRRGFFGFGEESRPRTGSDGQLVSDYRTDVHKGKLWTDDSGETRVIDNCNACHTRQYYKPAYSNVDLDADHNFPKGNGDADIRNDLDKLPGPLSCEYCHDTARTPALPSGQRTALAAHRERWKARGDMFGYAANTLDKVTKVHLDVVACQTCHIPSIEVGGKPFKLRYRYRVAEDGRLKVIPYRPATRFMAQDKTSGRVLYRYERQSVFQKRTGSDGREYGAIIDPVSGQELARVSLDDSGEFGTPTTYEGWKAWKRAYDELLKSKGYTNPDVRFVYLESNEYIVTHQTRSAPEAVPCTGCHARKQNGSINSLLASNGLFGEGNLAEVAKLPDRRLVDEGVVELGMPYFKVDGSGRITENAFDVLNASKLDPSMSILKAETAKSAAGELSIFPAGEATRLAGLESAAGTRLMQAMNSGEWMLFAVTVGDASIRGFGLMLAGDVLNRAVLKSARAAVESRDPLPPERKRIARLQAGRLASGIFELALEDSGKVGVRSVPTGDFVLKLPYRGAATKPRQIRVVFSDNGRTWRRLPQRQLAEFKPRGGDGAGYVVVKVPRIYRQLAIAGGPAEKG